nr:hypothetical protein BaRGS_020777 [Batillaria attramentaria]
MFRAVLVTLVAAATLVVKAQSAATTTTPTAATPVKLGTVEIIPRGARQFTVKVSFDVPYDMFGWFVHLVLDKPVDTLETSEADVTKRSGTEFDLSSEDWNRYLYAGNHLVITLVGNLTSNGTAIPSGGCTELRHTLRDPADLHTCSIVSSANIPSVVPEDECDDHVDGRITCDMLPNFCAVDYAKILCRKFCDTRIGKGL